MNAKEVTEIATEILQGWITRFRGGVPEEAVKAALGLVHRGMPVVSYSTPLALIEAIPNNVDELHHATDQLERVTKRLHVLADRLSPEKWNYPVEVAGLSELGMTFQLTYKEIYAQLLKRLRSPGGWDVYLTGYENVSIPRATGLIAIRVAQRLTPDAASLSAKDAAWVDALETLMVSGVYWVPCLHEVRCVPCPQTYYDSEGRLHREGAPAISYAEDAWGVFVEHGEHIEQVATS